MVEAERPIKTLQDIWKLFVYCTIMNATSALTKQLHHDEKILTLNSSIVCLSFKNRKGIIKIQVCSSVTDINQIKVIFFQ